MLIQLLGPSPEWPLAGYAVAQLVAALIVLPTLRSGLSFWPIDREIVANALRYGIPLIIGGALGWVGLNASRFIVNEMSGVAAAGLFAVGYGLGQRAAAVAAMLVTAAAFPLAVKSMEQEGSQAGMRQLADEQRAAGCDPGAKPRRYLHAEDGDRAFADRPAVPAGDARDPAALDARRRDPQSARPFRRPGISPA